MTRVFSVILCVFALMACGDVTGSKSAGANDRSVAAAKAGAKPDLMMEAPLFAEFPAARPTDFQPAEDVSTATQNELLLAVAASRQYSDMIRRNARSGNVQTPSAVRDLDRAKRDLIVIRDNLKSLSQNGPRTYALIHTAERGQTLKSWLISPEGGIVYDVSPAPYGGLDGMSAGLGVKRISANRMPRPKGEPALTDSEIQKAQALDQTRQAIEDRRSTLSETAATLLPGKVGDALGTRSGRLLIIPAYDTGTAPYAALPLANGYAAQNWSVVIVPGMEGLASPGAGFDFARLDINKAIIFGDPDLTDDTSFDWIKLPGARAEALAAAALLNDPDNTVLIDQNATQSAFTAAVKARADTGIVYIASHAVSSPKDPLNNAYIAMRGGRYSAGDIRKERFANWDKTDPIVVLSACQTGLGGTLQGGHFGVAQSWMAAGAGQVIASLWNVSDSATKILMTKFMAHLKAGIAPEFALQRAQLETLNYRDESGKFPYANDPKKWASFTVFGEPSRVNTQRE